MEKRLFSHIVFSFLLKLNVHDERATTMQAIYDLLNYTYEQFGSDLFVNAGKTAYIREKGTLKPFDAEPFDADMVDQFRQQVLLGPAEEKFQLNGSYDAGITLDDGHRFRINFFMQQGAPGFVARAVPTGNISFDDYNLPVIIRDFAELNRGLILIVGTAGSGKSTTMAAITNHINENFYKHIVTIEDPIEYVHKEKKCLVTQREIGVDSSSFADALRNVVRESPDVIIIGEMRDLETMQAAISAALTGHLVISTMHTADTVQCIERIINYFPEQQRSQVSADLALALQVVIGQRLVPEADQDNMIPAVELLKATPHVRNQIAARNFNELEEALRRGTEEGMVTFNRALADLYRDGRITLNDGAVVATNQDEFISLTQGMESGIETFRDAFHDDDKSKQLTLKRLLHSAVANDASDLIITAGTRPTLRVNGILNPLAVDPLTPSDTKRMLFSVLNSHQRAAFEEKREIDLALTVKIRRSKDNKVEGHPYRFRVNGFYQRGNVTSSIRIIPQKILTPEALGIPFPIVKLIEKKQGLLLVTGPTGHGKSTTLASLIDRINSTRSCHVITVEDPIEYVHPNKKAIIEQREVLSDTLSFPNALKYVLRQDPDVILIGEMRDPETIASAITAAETGHLVMATLHTNTAYQSVDRIIDIFPSNHQNQIRMQLSSCLLGVVSQRLIPKKDGNGRVAAFEVLVATYAVKALIREGKTHMVPSIMETATKDGMVTMDKCLEDLFRRGQITEQDFMSLKTISQNTGK